MKTKLFTKITAVIVATLFFFSNIPIAEAKLSKGDRNRLLGAGVVLSGLGLKRLGGDKGIRGGFEKVKSAVGNFVKNPVVSGAYKGGFLGGLTGLGYAAIKGKHGKNRTQAVLIGAGVGGTIGGMRSVIGEKNKTINTLKKELNNTKGSLESKKRDIEMLSGENKVEIEKRQNVLKNQLKTDKKRLADIENIKIENIKNEEDRNVYEYEKWYEPFLKKGIELKEHEIKVLDTSQKLWEEKQKILDKYKQHD